MIRLCTFTSDITPPVGHPLCAGWYPPARAIGRPLQALGLILIADGEPAVVLCALDWAELSNGDYDRWRADLARAVGTDPGRVAVHCTHAHDTPWPDRDAQDVLDAHGRPDVIMAGDWAERARAAAASAAAAALAEPRPCTHFSTGEARVDRVASNRRLIGPDGRLWAMRWTKTSDPMVRAAPEGLIDPMLKTIGFWNEDAPLAVAHYYAVHPTSLDGTGVVNPEFVGLARNRRTAAAGVPHLYFTGCAGNVAAGKYNDGIADNRELFAGRIHDAMIAAEQAAERHPLDELRWVVEPVLLPPRPDLDEEALLARIRAPATDREGAQQGSPDAYLPAPGRAADPGHLPPPRCRHLGLAPAWRDLHRVPVPRPGGALGCVRGGGRLRRPGTGVHHPGAIVRRGWLRADRRLRIRGLGGDPAFRDRPGAPRIAERDEVPVVVGPLHAAGCCSRQISFFSCSVSGSSRSRQ